MQEIRHHIMATYGIETDEPVKPSLEVTSSDEPKKGKGKGKKIDLNGLAPEEMEAVV